MSKLEKVIDWVKKQVAFAKTAWATVVIVLGFFGFELVRKETAPKPEPPVIEQPESGPPKIPVDGLYQ